MPEGDTALAAKGAAVLVLYDESEKSEAKGNAAQAELKIPALKAGAVVLVSASGSSAYRSGGGVNAGIILSLAIDDAVVARDDSFEGTASNIGFRSSASHTFYLAASKPATIRAKVDHYGTGSADNEDTKVSLCVIAIAARKA
jgi:hypothetical protein